MTSNQIPPQLIVVSAPSGAGKTSLCARLLEECSDRICLSRSATTRPPRGEEQNGVDYDFLSMPAFQAAIAESKFAEWALVHGNLYGTLKSTIEESFQAGKHVLLDIDVQGAKALRSAFPDRSVLVFIAPPRFEVLGERLRARCTESEEKIQVRLNNARRELTETHLFDIVVVNDALERAYSELKQQLTTRGLL